MIGSKKRNKYFWETLKKFLDELKYHGEIITTEKFINAINGNYEKINNKNILKYMSQ